MSNFSVEHVSALVSICVRATLKTGVAMSASLENTIRCHPFFHGMKTHHLAVLSEGATEIRYRPGEPLFNEGEPANRFFLLQQGSIVLEAHEPNDGTVVVQLLGPGDVFGWSWLFQPFTWHLRARALEHSTIISLDGGHLLGTAEQDHDFGYELMKRITQVVIQRLQATRRQLFEIQMEEALKG
jgi:CRP/FNR family transcriptional regulator, cyclic AMP receptor protein